MMCELGFEGDALIRNGTAESGVNRVVVVVVVDVFASKRTWCNTRASG
jgi:hypothetical protein